MCYFDSNPQLEFESWIDGGFGIYHLELFHQPFAYYLIIMNS